MTISLVEKGELTFRQLFLQVQIAINRARHGGSEEMKSKMEIINDTCILADDYVDDRLIRSGLNFKQRKISQPSKVINAKTLLRVNDKTNFFNSKNQLNALTKSEKVATIEAVRILAEKRHSPSGCLLTIDDISKVLLYVGETLEVRHPTVYTEILQQLNVRTLADVNLRRIYMNVARELFTEGISWSKIISLFAFSGGLAVDCVLNGSSIHVTRVKGWIKEFIEIELMDWIIHEGGWIGLFDHFTSRHQPKIVTNYVWTISAMFLLVAVFVAALMTYILKLS